MNPKTEIRKRIIERLKASVPEVGGRVYASRLIPSDPRHFPCILVSQARVTVDTPERGTPGKRPQTRTSAVVISVIDSALPDDTLDDRLDEIAMTIEAAVMSDPYLEDGDGVAAVEDIRIAATETSIVGHRGSVRGDLSQTWIATYRNLDGNPAVKLGR